MMTGSLHRQGRSWLSTALDLARVRVRAPMRGGEVPGCVAHRMTHTIGDE